MGGRLGGWGVELSEDEEGEQEDFMNGVSEMVRPFNYIADNSSGHLGIWNYSCYLATGQFTRYHSQRALLPVNLLLYVNP